MYIPSPMHGMSRRLPRALLALATLLAVPGGVRAQAPDSARVADSLALVRELEAAAQPPPPPPARMQSGGPVNPRLLPDISAVGDLRFDLSSGGTTQGDGSRFSVREIEVALQAAVDPYFRGDVFLGFNDEEGVGVEQAYLTATSLPWHLEVRLGRYLAPFGKQNTTHEHDLHTLEYPWVLQRFLSPEGLKGTGVGLSKIFDPFGFYQELILAAFDQFGERAEDLVADEPANKQLTGLGYLARLRNYWDLTDHANLEISVSGATGRRAQPIDPPTADEVNAVNARQSLFGVDVTYRWRPLQQGLYRSFIVQGEYMRQFNESGPAVPPGTTFQGPGRDFSGAYLFARYQLSRRGYLGVRGDLVEDPEADGEMLRAASMYYQFFPSEFSKLLAGYERLWPEGASGYGRLVIQATFALGPHRPHPF